MGDNDSVSLTPGRAMLLATLADHGYQRNTKDLNTRFLVDGWMGSLMGLSTETNTRVKYEGPVGYPGGSIWWAVSLIQGSDQEEICMGKSDLRNTRKFW